MEIENIKIQKFILHHSGDYDLSFIDENLSEHKEDFSLACVDIMLLAKSIFKPIDGEYILTCSCGEPECARIHYFYSWVTDDEVFWDVNNDHFRFNRKQYFQEILSKVSLMVNLDVRPATEEDEYYSGLRMNKELLLEIKRTLDSFL